MYIYIFYESWCDSSSNVWFKNMCVCVFVCFFELEPLHSTADIYTYTPII